jgi:hypothetical protein
MLSLGTTVTFRRSSRLECCGFRTSRSGLPQLWQAQYVDVVPQQCITYSQKKQFSNPTACDQSKYDNTPFNVEGKASSPVTGLEWPGGLQEDKVPRFLDNDTGWW